MNTAIERRLYEDAFKDACSGLKWSPCGFTLRNQDRLEAYTKGFRDAGYPTTATPSAYGKLDKELERMERDGFHTVLIPIDDKPPPPGEEPMFTRYSLPGLRAEFIDIRDLDAWHYSGFYLLFRYDGFGEIGFSLEGGRVIRREVLALN